MINPQWCLTRIRTEFERAAVNGTAHTARRARNLEEAESARRFVPRGQWNDSLSELGEIQADIGTRRADNARFVPTAKRRRWTTRSGRGDVNLARYGKRGIKATSA